MESHLDMRGRESLEGYLHDLICAVGSPEEVGVLVEVLMALQLRAPEAKSTRRKMVSA